MGRRWRVVVVGLASGVGVLGLGLWGARVSGRSALALPRGPDDPRPVIAAPELVLPDVQPPRSAEPEEGATRVRILPPRAEARR